MGEEKRLYRLVRNCSACQDGDQTSSCWKGFDQHMIGMFHTRTGGSNLTRTLKQTGAVLISLLITPMPFKQPGIYTNDTAITEHRSKDMTSEDSFSFNSYKRPECIIVSNRGPLEYYVDDDGSYRTRHGSGGLVTALLGAIQRRYVVWIALTMTETDQLGMQASSDTSASLPPALADMTLQLLSLPQQTYEQYYYHISNNVLWPAQHALLDPVIHTAFTQHTRDAWEQGYCKANNIVADAIIRVLKKWGTDVPVIIQDYQLYLVAEQVRAQCPEARLSHVIYIPWPDARYLAMLPKYMAQAIYHSLMMNDIIGFQTWHDARNFIEPRRGTVSCHPFSL